MLTTALRLNKRTVNYTLLINAYILGITKYPINTNMKTLQDIPLFVITNLRFTVKGCELNVSNNWRNWGYLKASSFQQQDLVIQIKLCETRNELGKPDHVTNNLVETLLKPLPAILSVYGLVVGHRIFNLQLQQNLPTISDKMQTNQKTCSLNTSTAIQTQETNNKAKM